MPTRAARTFTCFAIALLTTAILSPVARANSLANEILTILKRTDLGGARYAVSVREAGTGRPIVDIDANQPMIPASNMKVLTTGAAIHMLGPDFRFSTRIMLNGSTLIISGDGDPGLGDPDLLPLMGDQTRGGIDIEELISVWIDAIVRYGVTALDEIIIDDRVFDREFVHPMWPAEQLNRAYCAQVAGINFHLNVLHFHPQPASPGRPTIGDSVPSAPWITPANNATSITGASGSNSAWFARRLGTNRLTLYGNVRHVYRVPVPVTIHDPPTFVGELLAHRLRQRSVRIPDGAIRVAREDEPTFDAPMIAPPIQTPISVAARRANTDSQNMYAEALIKRIGYARTGRPGSWSDGAAVIRLAVHERLAEPSLLESLVVSDGSGLSRDNRVAPALLTQWIDSLISDDRTAEVFLDSLAEGGVSGTLRDRMRRAGLRDAQVQAKTGYIRGVSCLTGVVTAAGERRVFSIMFNSMTASNARAKDVQDRIVEAIVRDMVSASTPLGSD